MASVLGFEMQPPKAREETAATIRILNFIGYFQLCALQSMQSLSRLYKCRNYLQCLGIVLSGSSNGRICKIAAVRLREMKANGASVKEICGELGISRASVYRVLESAS
jgi:hypothetical protein